MEAFVFLLLNMLAFATILFLQSVGLSIGLGLMNFVNLAHGSFFLMAGYIAAYVIGRMDTTLVATVATFIVVPLLMAALGWVLHKVLFRQFYNKTHFSQVMMTYALALIIAEALRATFGSYVVSMPLPDPLRASVGLVGGEYPLYRLLMVLIGGLASAALYFVFERSAFGVLVRGGVADRQMAEACGVDTEKLSAKVMAYSVGLAALGGVLGANMLALFPGLDTIVVLQALVVVILGGLGNFRGVVVASVALGAMTVLVQTYWPDWAAVVIYAALTLALILRPSGFVTMRERTV